MSTVERVIDSLEITSEDGLKKLDSDMNSLSDGMLEYETQLFLDIVQKDGIVVAAKGVCLLNVISSILRVYADPGNLIIVINHTEHEERQLTKHLLSSNVEASLLHTTTYSSASTDDRHELYLSGGVHFVTTRILVLDFLKHRVPIAKITGIVVLNAHRVLESGQEAFVMRLYKETNKNGFVQAFSTDAQSFAYGFGQLERIMRNLFVREVHICPRFHSSVIASLKVRAPPDLIELHIPITSGMERIQTCLLELINTLIREIKAANKTVELAELTVENSLLPKFMRLLTTQLDGIWERLSSASRRLTSELRALHQLLVRHLFHNDAVALYAHVQQYKSREYVNNATWPYYREADQLFTAVQDRVLSNTNEFNPEYCPKWKPLVDILSLEIPTHIANTKHTNSTTVLILCQDRKTCHQLNQFLRYGPRHYLLMQALQNGVKFGKMSDAFKSCKVSIPCEANIALVSDKRKQNQSKKNVVNLLEQAEEGQGEHEAEEGQGEDEEEQLKNVYHLTMNESINFISENDEKSVHEDSQYIFEPITTIEEASGTISLVIRTFREAVTGDVVATLPEALQCLRPAYVVLYHANVTAIRQLEIYEARKTDTDVRTKIFFLVHGGTVEEQSYLTSLRREKQAFEYLIETKSRMVVPEDQDGHSSDMIQDSPDDAASSSNNSSRAGGASNNISAKSTVIVDMREFRSELPALLHKRGIHIEPITITVGDYILTPSICVERKSLSDLVGSLKSGRLYAQCTAMQRTYSKPMLLIEFDQNKPFSWDCMHYMISTDEESGSFDVQRRLVLLTMHFPKLRIIWSPNPYATAALFQELKEGKDEPNAAHIQASQDQQHDIAQTCKYNAVLSDVLPRLPGVSSRSAIQLMAKFLDLADLSRATELQMKDILTVGRDAKALYTALHGDTAVARETDSRGKKSGGPRNKFKYMSVKKSKLK